MVMGSNLVRNEIGILFFYCSFGENMRGQQ